MNDASARAKFVQRFAEKVLGDNVRYVTKAIADHPWVGLEAIDRFGWPVMHCAASRGYCDILRLLAQHGVPVDARTVNYITPFDLAVFNEEVNSVEQLIKLGADVDENTERNWCIEFDCAWSVLDAALYAKRETALQYAIRAEKKEIATSIRTTWSKTAHRNLVGLCLALAQLSLPAYVVLWIIDWLPEYALKPEIRKIRLIQGVTESVRGVATRKKLNERL
jgi:hypothetical protein